jgi:hypothetical protein
MPLPPTATGAASNGAGAAGPSCRRQHPPPPRRVRRSLLSWTRSGTPDVAWKTAVTLPPPCGRSRISGSGRQPVFLGDRSVARRGISGHRTGHPPRNRAEQGKSVGFGEALRGFRIAHPRLWPREGNGGPEKAAGRLGDLFVSWAAGLPLSDQDRRIPRLSRESGARSTAPHDDASVGLHGKRKRGSSREHGFHRTLRRRGTAQCGFDSFEPAVELTELLRHRSLGVRGLTP